MNIVKPDYRDLVYTVHVLRRIVFVKYGLHGASTINVHMDGNGSRVEEDV